MKGWMVAIAMSVVIVAAGIGLWATWDTTQARSADPIDRIADLTSGTAATQPTTTATTTPATPACDVAEEPVEGDPVDDWQTIVVDPSRRLPDDFAPPDLVAITEAGFESPDMIRRIVLDDLTALREAAQANGTPLTVVSAYRTPSYQGGLYQRQVDRTGEDQASLHTARAGHSEHQLGTTIDVLNPEATDLTTDFATTPAGKWVGKHAHEHGFVLSYPADSLDVTCYEFEPWHLRYVGREVAAEIAESGKTPREWMLAQRVP